MEISAPRPITFWIAAVIAVAGVVIKFSVAEGVAVGPFNLAGLLVGVAYAILALGCVLKGL